MASLAGSVRRERYQAHSHRTDAITMTGNALRPSSRTSAIANRVRPYSVLYVGILFSLQGSVRLTERLHDAG